MNLTDLRKRAIKMLDQRGEMRSHDFTYDLVKRKHGSWSPQGATRWAGGYMAPLIRAGFVKQRFDRTNFGIYYSVTAAGRAAVR